MPKLTHCALLHSTSGTALCSKDDYASDIATPNTNAKVYQACSSSNAHAQPSGTKVLLHNTYTCAFKPGCLMSHNWFHTPN